MNHSHPKTTPCIVLFALATLTWGCSNERDGSATKSACIAYVNEANAFWQKASGEEVLDLSVCETIDTDVDTAADDPAIIGFTSGSTGTPKGTLHFHRDILAAADCFIGHVVKIGPGDIVCGSPQIAFLYGLCAFIADTFRFGANYAETLDRWLTTFDAKQKQVRDLGFDDGFIRLWRFYLASCSGAFRSGRTDVMQVELRHA